MSHNSHFYKHLEKHVRQQNNIPACNAGLGAVT